MRQLQKDIALVAASDLCVLVTGETGTGKELVAQAVHAQSGRADKPMISINCAALPDNLVESELFGHVRGAFTGALSERSGKFEQAHQGTLFLDEVGELSLPVQAKLLRVLQSGQLQRLGSDREHHVDVRVIAATNRDLAAEVGAGRMRADFYHRLNVYPLNVPPLRGATAMLQLAGYFLEENRSRLRLGGLRLDAAAQAALLNRSWPGNVRELEHCISRAVLRALSRHDGSASRAGARLRIVTLGLADLWERAEAPAAEQAQRPWTRPPTAAPEAGLRAAVSAYERQLVSSSLARHQGSWAAAARELQLDRANLQRLAKRLEIDRP
jgi:anaerobic nitric oxide reductase transcription regulator